MGTILQSEISIEIKNLIEENLDLNSDIIYFPIRHHSPICSYHLLKIIDLYNPEAILIEAPRNAENLIDSIGSLNDVKPPFCIYSSYNDKEKLVNEDGNKYKAVYPFLKYSPEYVAILEGKKKNLNIEFIDFCFGDKLINSLEDHLDEDERYILSGYYDRLIKNGECKDINEFWEKYFEIEGLYYTPTEFIKNMLLYCHFTRETTKLDNIDLNRELYMGSRILEAKKKYKKILVVTGGYHSLNIMKLVKTGDIKHQFKFVKDDESLGYLMPYRMNYVDTRSGYNAGMIYPAFYNKIWENIGNNTPYNNLTMEFILNIAKYMRERQPVSVADEIQSYYMANGLARLRGKKESGVFELIDGVRSSFLKGAINQYCEPVLEYLNKILTGFDLGAIKLDSKNRAPIVQDFYDKCKKFKIDLTAQKYKESRLDIFNKEEHKLKSMFFYQVSYLVPEFCQENLGKGNLGKGAILTKENWRYRYTPDVEISLIEKSMYGITIEDACIEIILENLKNSLSAKDLSKILYDADRMRLNHIYQLVFNKLENTIWDDNDFISIGECFKNLSEIKKYNLIFDETKINSLDILINISFQKLIKLTYDIAITKGNEDEILDILKYMYLVSLDDENMFDDFIYLMENIEDIEECNLTIIGFSLAVLYKHSVRDIKHIIDKFDFYFSNSTEVQKELGNFLTGFFQIGKELLLIDTQLINCLDGIISNLDTHIFMAILPELRYSFTQFQPFEVNKISSYLKNIYDDNSYDFTTYGIDDKKLTIYSKTDEYCKSMFIDWIKGDREDGK